MKSNEALDARLSALENLVSVLILSRAACWKTAVDRLFELIARFGDEIDKPT
tara:strand:+ start:783 stop:938 length:156 start_codon:yes stop_codon:yes gene_type:complete